MERFKTSGAKFLITEIIGLSLRTQIAFEIWCFVVDEELISF